MSKVISVVGAGGKTSYIHRLKDEITLTGKTCLVTTTTHMMLETDTDISCDKSVILQKLIEYGYCMAGRLCEDNPKKITAPDEDLLTDLIGACDYCLIEADGARHYNVKYPGNNEPNVYANSDEVVVIMGLEAIGNTIENSIFRYELLLDDFDLCKNDIVTFDLINRIVSDVYIPKINNTVPNAEIKVTYSVRNECGKLDFLDFEEAAGLYE